jgi:hypothetical protein
MAILALFIVNLYPHHAQAQTNGEEYTVFCYVGDPSSGDHIDSFDTLNPSQATELCNETYNTICNGKCIGCYLKEGREICTDRSGKQFTR